MVETDGQADVVSGREAEASNPPTACVEAALEAHNHGALCTFRRVRLSGGWTLRDLRAAIAAHEACVAGGAGCLLKDDSHSAVSLVPRRGGGPTVCVKELRWRGVLNRWKDLLRPSQARREWRNLHRLRALGLNVPAPLMLAEAPLSIRLSRSFLVMEGILDAEALDRYAVHVSMAPRRRRLAFLAAVAGFLRGLHDRGFCHLDMKPANVLVRDAGEGWEFFMVDLVDVRLGRRVRRRHVALNLAQLNAKVPLVVTTTDRLRFLRLFLPAGTPNAALRRLWRDVLAITRTRRCIWDYPERTV